MQFEVKENVIIIKDFTQFNIQQILECGQFFRFIKTQNGYEIYSLDKYAYATVFEDRCEITCTDVNYFINFFDLDADYNQIKHNLVNINNYLNNAISYGYGIRLLKQDIFEMFITFIISANNNIKRIQNSVFKLCEMFGTNMKNYFAFPTYSQLLNASIQDFIYCGLGYRAEQLYKALRQLKTANLNNLNNLDSNQLSIELQKFSGIGPKVASCILLFGFSF